MTKELTKEEMVAMLQAGKVDEWNDWRKRNPKLQIYLAEEDLCRLGLYDINFSGVCFDNANLSGTHFWRADLTGANFSEANLSGADFFEANLSEANLQAANLDGADLTGANLSGADLSLAEIGEASVTVEQLTNAKNLNRVLNPPNAVLGALAAQQHAELMKAIASLKS